MAVGILLYQVYSRKILGETKQCKVCITETKKNWFLKEQRSLKESKKDTNYVLCMGPKYMVSKQWLSAQLQFPVPCLVLPGSPHTEEYLASLILSVVGIKQQWKNREGWIEKKWISGLRIFFFQLQHRNHAQIYLFMLFMCLCHSKNRKLKGKKKSTVRTHTNPQQSFKGYQVRQIIWHQWINAQDLALSAVFTDV